MCKQDPRQVQFSNFVGFLAALSASRSRVGPSWREAQVGRGWTFLSLVAESSLAGDPFCQLIYKRSAFEVFLA